MQTRQGNPVNQHSSASWPSSSGFSRAPLGGSLGGASLGHQHSADPWVPHAGAISSC